MRYLPTPPKEFSSDGVSGLISALHRRIYGKEIPWVKLAVKHDWVYYFGGPSHLRLAADKEIIEGIPKYYDPIIVELSKRLARASTLRNAIWTITKILFYAILPHVVYAGVRIGGVWWLPYKTARWGYGYPFPQRGPQDSDYVTPPITEEALNVHIRDEITGKEV